MNNAEYLLELKNRANENGDCISDCVLDFMLSVQAVAVSSGRAKACASYFLPNGGRIVLNYVAPVKKRCSGYGHK